MGRDGHTQRSSPNMQPLRLNTWTSFLVLLAIQTQIYDFSQEFLIARKFSGGNESDEDAILEDEDGLPSGVKSDRDVNFEFCRMV